MLPAYSPAMHSQLFQPWQPGMAPEGDQSATTPHQSDYIELPRVYHYHELKSHGAFLAIQFHFLSDIQELKWLAHSYVNHQYDAAIDAFYRLIREDPDHLQDSLLPLYRETRFQIHRLVMQLNNEQNAENIDTSTSQSAYIASVLHDCLNGIEHCPAGIHSRFNLSFLDLEASRAGLDGKLFIVRKGLFREFIESFLVQQQREGRINIPKAMEVHWYNSLYNLYCEPLGLPTEFDPSAITHLGNDLTQHFLSAVQLSVNTCTVLRKIAAEWSDQLSATLELLGVSAWERGNIDPAELTSDIAEVLDSKLFKPINFLLNTPVQPLNLLTVLEEKEDGHYCLDHYREKLLAWVTNHFCGSSVNVFAAIPGPANRLPYIGTINELFFWVFHHDQSLCKGQVCAFEADNYTTLQLSHLTAIDFSTWPENACHVLLTQAMEQTHQAEEIASFILHPAIRKQLAEIPVPVVQVLTNQLTHKLVHNGSPFKEELCQCIRDRLAHSKSTTVLAAQLSWLMDTPLLEPVLSELRQRGVDHSAMTQSLDSWQIADISEAGLRELLRPQDCQRLFRQALTLKQGGIMSRLLLTGHCDHLTHLLSGHETLLVFFSRLGILPGLKYLLSLDGIKVNNPDAHGRTPLGHAAHEGHKECLVALLAAPGIKVNKKDANHWAPLNCAARKGHVECVKVLLKAPGIKLNEKDPNGLTPLGSAARKGHPACVRALLQAPQIKLNEKDLNGSTALNCAAKKGYAECVSELMNAPGIKVNEKDANGWTPLNSAARNGHTQCVRELLKAPDIELNEKDNGGLTPLNSAASKGYTECVRALLEAPGIKVNARDTYGSTPLNNAARKGRKICVCELLNAPDIQVNKSNKNGLSPLISAAAAGYSECIRALLDAPGIQVNAKEKNGFTPLNAAARYGHIECVKALLAVPEIKVNEKNYLGSTPLINAASQGYVDCIAALLQAPGIRVNDVDNAGFTALNVAASLGFTQCIRALLKAPGIQVNKKNKNSYSPLDSAYYAGHDQCVSLLLSVAGVRGQLARRLATEISVSSNGEYNETRNIHHPNAHDRHGRSI